MSKFSERRLLILYGSQTGTAQGVAERLSREAKRFHFIVDLSPMNDYLIKHLINETLAVFVCSTTGQGDVPDNMKKFWKFLLRRDLPSNSLESLQFGVLGLGDSGYQKFNFSGKRLAKRLEQLGAVPILPIGLADDQHDLGPDAVVDHWLKSLIETLNQKRPLPDGLEPLPSSILLPSKYCISSDLSANLVHDVSHEDGYSQSCPYSATLFGCERVTPVEHFQDTRLVSFCIDKSDIQFSPGDVCMVQPQNLDESVDRFVNLFRHLDVDKKFCIVPSESNVKMPSRILVENPTTLRSCAKTLFDLQAIPGRYFFELLSHFTKDQNEKEKFLEFTTAEGQQEIYEYCNRPRRNILEVLEDFTLHTVPNIPLEYLFELFPSIKPRAFSISSSLSALPNRLELLVAVVKYKSKMVTPRLGLCTNWLISLQKGEKVNIWIKGGTFKFPPSSSLIPVVFVGPGTGVAPFRSYISDRLHNQDSRQIVLFFGCRHSEKDNYFSSEWHAYEKEHSNIKILTAFSRQSEDGPKIYVQDIMGDNSDLLFNLIHEQKGLFYVAGRAKQMPDQVRQSLKNSLMNQGQLDEKTAEEYLTKMELENRYQTETWS